MITSQLHGLLKGFRVTNERLSALAARPCFLTFDVSTHSIFWVLQIPPNLRQLPSLPEAIASPKPFEPRTGALRWFRTCPASHLFRLPTVRSYCTVLTTTVSDSRPYHYSFPHDQSERTARRPYHRRGLRSSRWIVKHLTTCKRILSTSSSEYERRVVLNAASRMPTAGMAL